MNRHDKKPEYLKKIWSKKRKDWHKNLPQKEKDKIRKKISETLKRKYKSGEFKPVMNEKFWRNKKKRDKERTGKPDYTLRGKKNPNYTTGRTVGYNNDYKIWREAVLKRDNYVCQHCGKKTKNVHHIIPISKDKNLMHNINNGITLCQSCHVKVHKFWLYRKNLKNE